MELLSYLIGLAFSFLFFYSFYSKVTNPYLVSEVYSYVKMPYSLLLIASGLLLFLELLLATSFILCAFPVIQEAVLLIVLIVFIFLTINKNRKGSSDSCTCFGNLTALNQHPLLRNGILIFLAVIKLLLPYKVPNLIEILLSSFIVIAFSIGIEAFLDYRRIQQLNGVSIWGKYFRT